MYKFVYNMDFIHIGLHVMLECVQILFLRGAKLPEEIKKKNSTQIVLFYAISIIGPLSYILKLY